MERQCSDHQDLTWLEALHKLSAGCVYEQTRTSVCSLTSCHGSILQFVGLVSCLCTMGCWSSIPELV
eukprot:3255238-Amphidinium_carterae.1